jgi:putative nucleotidyltransferase with HDIG domain
MIGMKQIRDMVMATAATRAFNGLPNNLVTMDNFWSHSTYCGLAARILADHCSKGQGESLFIAGLLHDIGQLIIFNKLPELAQKALMASIEDPGEPELWAVERDIIGFDHCQAGVALARKWQLPELLQECIEFHHQPEGAKTFPVPVAIIHIANSLAYLAETNSTELDDAPKIHPSALETTGISSDVFLTTVEAAREQYGEVKSAIFAD